MKIRSGFVSNSSSSSFVVVTPNNYDYTTQIEDEDLKELYKRIFREEIETFGNEKVKIYRGWQDTSCGENSIADTGSFDKYCEKKNIDENDYCEVAEQLFNQFTNYFDKTCLQIWSE